VRKLRLGARKLRIGVVKRRDVVKKLRLGVVKRRDVVKKLRRRDVRRTVVVQKNDVFAEKLRLRIVKIGVFSMKRNGKFVRQLYLSS